MVTRAFGPRGPEPSTSFRPAGPPSTVRPPSAEAEPNALSIVVITTLDEDGKTVASHGVEIHTGKSVTLPSEHPSALWATRNLRSGEWYL